MADSQLSVELVARVGQLEQSLAEAIRSVRNAETQIDASVNSITAAVNNISPATNNAFTGMSENIRGTILRFNELSSSVSQSLGTVLTVIQGNAELFGRTLTTQQQQIQAYKTAINQLLAGGYSTASNEVQELVGKVNGLTASIQRQQSFLERQKSALTGAFGAPVGIIGSLENSLASLRVKLTQATDTKSIENYNKAIQGIQKNIDALRVRGIEQAVGGAATVLRNGLTPAASSATFAISNLGRVASDAPFGFIAISNNLDPLLQSFRSLYATSGSVKGALSALGASLIGGGGLALAFSLVTAAGVYFTQQQQKAAKAAREVSGENRAFVDTLNSVRQAILKGTQAGAEQTVRLQLLYKATQNATLSLKDRNLAFDELNKKYPTFFTNADREKTLLGQNSEAYNRLASSIIAAANARAFEQKIGENSNRRFEDLEKITDKQNALDKASLALIQARNVAQTASAGIAGNTQSSLTGGGGQANAALAAVGRVTQAQEQVNKLTSERNNLITDANKLLQQNAKLAELALQAEKGAGFKDGGAFDDKPTKAKTKKTKFDPIGAGLGQSGIPLFEQGQLVASVAGQTDQVNKLVESTRAFTDAKIAERIAREQNNKATEKEKELLDITINTIGGGLTDAFASAITGASNFFSSLGQLLVGIVAKLIAAAAAAAALAALIAFTPLGGLSIFKGFSGGFSSTASGLFSTLSGLPKLAEGGVVSKPTLALIGEGKEPEAVVPLSKLDAMMGASADRVSARVEPFLLPNGILLQAVENGQNQRGRRGRG